MENIIVTNTSPLINLGKAGRIDLITKLFSQSTVIIPAEVFEEIQRKRDNICKAVEEMIISKQFTLMPKGIDECKEETKNIAIKMATEYFNQNPESLNPEKHMVEAYVIHLAKKMNAKFVLLDEVAARRVAREEGLLTFKHTAIIEECFEKEIISMGEAHRIVKTLIKEGVNYKNPKELLNKYAGND